MVVGQDNNKVDLKEMGFESVTWFQWLRIIYSCELFQTRQSTFGLHKIRGIFWLSYRLSVSEESIYCVEWVKGKSEIENPRPV